MKTNLNAQKSVKIAEYLGCDDSDCSCTCSSEIAGEFCEVTPCVPFNPCINGRLCSHQIINNAATFQCICPLGWEGMFCHKVHGMNQRVEITYVKTRALWSLGQTVHARAIVLLELPVIIVKWPLVTLTINVKMMICAVSILSTTLSISTAPANQASREFYVKIACDGTICQNGGTAMVTETGVYLPVSCWNFRCILWAIALQH